LHREGEYGEADDRRNFQINVFQICFLIPLTRSR
jgi:hypothetical protein